MAEMLCMCAPLFVGVCLCAGIRLHSHTKIDRRYGNNSFNRAPCVASSPLTLLRWALCSTELSMALTVTRWMSSRKHCLAAVQRMSAALRNIADIIHIQRVDKIIGTLTIHCHSITNMDSKKQKVVIPTEIMPLQGSYKGIVQPVPCRNSIQMFPFVLSILTGVPVLQHQYYCLP